jgi:hypothetical protein
MEGGRGGGDRECMEGGREGVNHSRVCRETVEWFVERVGGSRSHAQYM